MSLHVVPLETGRIRWRRAGNGEAGEESHPVYALVIAPTEELDRRPRTWALNGYGDWLPVGHGPGEGRLI